MRKIKNHKLIFILFIVIIFTFVTFFIIKYFNNEKYISNNMNNDFYPYSYVNNIDKTSLNKYFSNRSIYFLDDNIFLVGKNDKELQNGYYDLKFNIKETYLLVTINKLQKGDIAINPVSDEYLIELIKFIKEILNYEEVNELKDYIKEEYLNLRKNTQCISSKDSIRKINLGSYMVILNIRDNMLELNIKF